MSKTRSSQEKNEPYELNGQNISQDNAVKETAGEALFMEMLDSYQDAIFRFLYFRVSSRAVALDITQDTFTRVWSYLAGGKDIQYPEAFLYRAAKNALIDYYKKEKPISLDSLMESGYDPQTNRDTDEILRQDDITEVRDMLENISEDDRQIIHLRFTEERPIEEIANIYDKSTNAMTVQIHRIIKKLKIQYENKHGK